MKQNRKTKNIQTALYTVVCLMLTAVFMLAAVPKQIKAAEKPRLSQTEMAIGIGARNVLTVYETKEKAAYSFVSKNKKVATVKKKGTDCYITGIKIGKTTMICYQTLNKKKTVVGKCKQDHNIFKSTLTIQ